MVHVFDTSALNRLATDPGRESIVENIRASGGSIRISELNRLEILSTEDQSKRCSLEALLGLIADHDTLLIFPWEILRRCAQANLGSRSAAFELGRHWSVSSPENGDLEELRAWMREGARLFDRCLSGSSIEEVLTAAGYRPQASDRRFAPTIRKAVRNSEQCRGMAVDLYSSLMGKNLEPSTAAGLFRDHPEWLIYVGSWFYEMHRKGIKPSASNLLPKKQQMIEGLGGRTGFWDYMFAVYLPHCDVFVTDDLGRITKPGPHGGQYKALRVLRHLCPPGRRAMIRTYDQLRRSLGLDFLTAPEAA